MIPHSGVANKGKVFVRLCAKFCVSWSERALYHKVGSYSLLKLIRKGIFEVPLFTFIYINFIIFQRGT